MAILLEGLCFGEGPRWRDGKLWFSDMHDQRVCTVTTAGEKQVVLKLEDDQPSGLGWLPDGRLLVVSMTKRQLLIFDGTTLEVYADLSHLAPYHCNDMVVDSAGRAYVGNFGFNLHQQAKPNKTNLIRVDPDCSAKVVAEDVFFPNGTVITPDEKTLIVGETFARVLSAFDIDPDGGLSNRRVWAQLPKGAVPDGICLDSDGGIWSASPSSNDCIRQIEGGKVTHRIDTGRGAFACMIGGDNLFILTSSSSDPAKCRANRDARIEVFPAPYSAAGYP
jgi:sugar lactone lactonase YvrE